MPPLASSCFDKYISNLKLFNISCTTVLVNINNCGLVTMVLINDNIEIIALGVAIQLSLDSCDKEEDWEL